MSDACPRCGTRYPDGRLAVCPVCLLQAELPPPLLGESLELIEEIGRGGMGSVWKARHRRLGRTVAVKLLPEGRAGEADLERRLEREARALALLEHPNIVAVHDLARHDGRSYLVMEYVDGQPLSALLPLPPERAVEVALQVCEALAYAHGRGIVHRDVKPENVLVDGAGRVKVSDFGIARLLGAGDADWAVTSAEGVVGTPPYLAPEALAGAPPDPRLDVYALGVLLYEMVTGERPVGDFAALAPPLDRIVRRALAPRPERRYQGVEEMRHDLEAARGRAAADTAAELGPDERNWRRAVALLQSLATAVALWALLLAVTPRVLAPGEVRPLVMLGTETLADGRIVSRARFETWPALAAVAALVLASAAHGLLRRHWRQAGLDRPQPARPLRASRWVLASGMVSLAVYAARRLFEGRALGAAFPYVPLLGGLIELAALFLFWTAVLEAQRTSRSLAREPALWLGVALALVPPVTELTGYLLAWRP